MGFLPADVHEALCLHNFNLHRAVAYLMDAVLRRREFNMFLMSERALGLEWIGQQR
jgi:hypothetical protein